MKKRESIELADQVQLYIWTSGIIALAAFTIMGLVEGIGWNMRSSGVCGIMILLCVANLNIVLNRFFFREAMRKAHSTEPTVPQS